MSAVAECEQGVALLQQALPDITSLRDVSSAQLEAHKELLPETVYRRCRHVVTENERVLATIEALKRDDLVAVGKLMNASHASLRDDYEVSSPGAGCHGRSHAQRHRAAMARA